MINDTIQIGGMRQGHAAMINDTIQIGGMRQGHSAMINSTRRAFSPCHCGLTSRPAGEQLGAIWMDRDVRSRRRRAAIIVPHELLM